MYLTHLQSFSSKSNYHVVPQYTKRWQEQSRETCIKSTLKWPANYAWLSKYVTYVDCWQCVKTALLTLVAQVKHVVTTLEITSIRPLVSWITLSTLVKVAALPTVGFFTVNCSCCTYVGTRSRFSSNSFLWIPPGTYKGTQVKLFRLYSQCHQSATNDKLKF